VVGERILDEDGGPLVGFWVWDGVSLVSDDAWEEVFGSGVRLSYVRVRRGVFGSLVWMLDRCG